MDTKSEIIDELKNLTNQIDLSNININKIEANTKKLLNLYMKLREIWIGIDETNIKYKIYVKTDSKYNKIKSIVNNSFLAENANIKNIIVDSKFVHSLSYSNIAFYWFSNSGLIDKSNQDYLIGLEMMKTTICLNNYRYPNGLDKIKRIIVWVPINKERNFIYNTINQTNLKKTEDNFEAFVASGVTYGINPRITIITRYEEVQKLLIHELIHNFYIDGSNYHNELNDIISKYRIIKNDMPNSTINKKNYDYEYSIYESYTELLSTYFYLIFKNLSNNVGELDIEEKILGQIIIELLYSYNLICNLAKINGYQSYDEFMKNMIFEGTICTYEYYFLKGLMYNNFDIEFGKDIDDFKNIYVKIIEMIEKIKFSDDILLNQIYLFQKKQKNFAYQIN